MNNLKIGIRLYNGNFTFHDVTLGKQSNTLLTKSYIEYTGATANETSVITFNTLELNSYFYNSFYNKRLECEHLLLLPNQKYTFKYSQNPFVVKQSINSRANDCQQLTIEGGVSPYNQGFHFRFDFENPEIKGAIISGVTVDSPKILKVINGIDKGNNTNVDVVPMVPKTYYWIGDEGLWSEPKNWTTDPNATTADQSANTNICLPGSIDHVLFTANSFVAGSTGSKVILDMPEIDIKTMVWQNGVNVFKPQFTNIENTAQFTINIYGYLEFAEDMTVDFAHGNVNTHNILMLGTGTNENDNYLDTKGIRTWVYLEMKNGGRFDIRSNLEVQTIKCVKSSLYSHGHDITASKIDIRQDAKVSGKVIDLEGSVLTQDDLYYQIIDCANWHSSTTDIIVNDYSFMSITDNCDVHFNSIEDSAVYFTVYGGINKRKVIAKTLKILGSNKRIRGNFEIDSLILSSNISPVLEVVKGSTITINKGIKAKSSPCNPAVIRTIGNQHDDFITIKNGNCSKPLYFYGFKLKNVHSDLQNGCTVEDYQVWGSDLGGSPDFTYTPLNTGNEDLGEQTLTCQDLPHTEIIGIEIPAENYQWFKDGVAIPGATSNEYIIDEDGAGDYEVKLDYTQEPMYPCHTSYTKKFILDLPDTDGDGITDCSDLDDDNDGILDGQENAYSFVPSPLNVLVVTSTNITGNVSDNMILEFSGAYLPGSNITVRKVDFANTPSPASGYFDGFDLVVFGSSLQKIDNAWWNELETAVKNRTSKSFVIYNDRSYTGGHTNTLNGTNFLNNIFGTSYVTNDLINDTIIPVPLNPASKYIERIGHNPLVIHSYATINNVAPEDAIYLNNYEGNSDPVAIMKQIPGGSCDEYLFYITDISIFDQVSGRYFYNKGKIAKSFALAFQCNALPDFDKDGIPNKFDLDSDNDNCPDAIEGGADFTIYDLVEAASTLSSGSEVTQNLCNGNDCVNTTDADKMGIPNIADIGQSINNSQKATQISIGEAPQNIQICVGNEAKFTAKATAQSTTTFDNSGNPDFTAGTTEDVIFQWYVSSDGGINWTAEGVSDTIASDSIITLNLGLQNDTNRNNYQYMVEVYSVSMACKSLSNAATLRVYGSPTFTDTNTEVCVGNTITVKGSGTAATPVAYESSNTDIATVDATDGLVTGVSAGTVNITYTNSNGCDISKTITVNVKPTVAATAYNTTVCAGEQVILTGSGANTHTWDNGITDSTAFTPPVGTTTYTVTGIDANGCTNTASIDITVHIKPNVTANADNTPVCAGEQVTLTGGGAVTYTWDNGVVDGIAFTPPVGTTTYTVTGTDSNGCIDTASVDITVHAVPNSPISGGDQVACATNPIQTLIASATVQSGETLVWYDAEVGGNIVTNPELNKLGTVTYWASAKYTTLTCENKERTAVKLTINPSPKNAYIIEDVTVCEGSEAILLQRGSELGVNYQLQTLDNQSVGAVVRGTGDTISYSLSTNENATYKVLATVDSSNCKAELADKVTVKINSIAAGSIEGQSNVCEGDDIATFTEITSATGTGRLSYQWQQMSNEEGWLDIDGATENIYKPEPLNITTSYRRLVYSVENNISCSSVSNELKVIVTPLPVLNTSSTIQQFCKEDDSRIFDIDIEGTNITWYIDEALQSPIIDTAILLNGSTYYAISISDNQCGSKILAITVYVDKCKVDVVIPNGFSPNGDGINDYFVIQGIEYFPDNNLLIINRWGNKVYEAAPYKNNWDGTNHYGLTIRDNNLPEGTYFYIFKYKNKEGKMIVKKGYVYLRK